MPPASRSIPALAKEHGIAEQTLYTWRRALREQGIAVPSQGKKSGEWSSPEKFGVVLETASMGEAELAEYCRRKGIFVEQVAEWRAACMSANANAAERAKEERAQAKVEKKEIKDLKRELARKEKALAEAAALLVLRKKARAIWGGNEED